MSMSHDLPIIIAIHAVHAWCMYLLYGNKEEDIG